MGGELKEVAIPDVHSKEVELPFNITSKVKLWKNASGDWLISKICLNKEDWDSKDFEVLIKFIQDGFLWPWEKEENKPSLPLK